MVKRRRILNADKIVQNVIQVFCLLMFLQFKHLYCYQNAPLLLYTTDTDIRTISVDSIGANRQLKSSVILKNLVQGYVMDFLYKKQLVCWSETELIQCTHFNGTHTGERYPGYYRIDIDKYHEKVDQFPKISINDQVISASNCVGKMRTVQLNCFRIIKTDLNLKCPRSTEIQIVTDSVVTPSGIAIDWYTEKLYWTDGETNKVEVISLDSNYRKVLFWTDVDLARAIVVVPKYGLMFWTDWGDVPKIERAGMNGDPKTRTVIVKDQIIWPNGITVDYTNNLIYWVDAKMHFLEVVDFDGKNRRHIVKDGLKYPYALTYFNYRLFWTDWETWNILTYDMNTTTAMALNMLKSNVTPPMDIKVLDESRQVAPSYNPCQYNNGGCSHLCLLAPYPPGYTCACQTGIKLKENSNTTCHPAPLSLLIVAQRSSIFKISLDSPDYTPYTLPLKDVKKAVAVDYDPKYEYIYWADTVAKTISRARLDGSDQNVIIRFNAGMLENIAVDPLARNIYWTDTTTDTISVARLDGSSKKVLIHGDLYDPRAIALHPTAGLMFWSDWNDKIPKIERANLDGSDRILLISERLKWPNGIALDKVSNKMYWGDARTHKIEECNLDGSNRRELQNNDIVHIFGLTLLGDHLYWIDIQRRALERINRLTGYDREPLIEQMPNMLGVKAFRVGEKIGWNPCVDNNGNCSHLCFNKPAEYVCSCPLGLELGEDRRSCYEPEAFLVYSRKNIIGIVSVENEHNNAVLPLKEVKEVSAIATHISGQRIYWSDGKTKTISRCSLGGTNIEKVLDAAGLVEGIVIDWCGQNIYWCDATSQRIEVARLDGSSRRVLIWQGLKKPKSLALDPKRGYMYWSELGSRTIKRASMDGTSISVLLDQVGRVYSLAIDFERRTIYWAASDPPALEFAHLNGSGRQKLLGSDIPMPYAVALYTSRMYWGDWTTGDIEVANKMDASNRRKIYKKLDFISDLKVYHKSHDAGVNQCSIDNGGCSHLCLALPGEDHNEASYRCSCPTHYKLNKDNLTCSEPEEFLLYAQKNSLGRIMVASGECNDAVIPIAGLRNIKAIEYDPINRFLYWMDDDSHSIRRVRISYSATSVSDADVVLKDIFRPFHMVLDVLGRALYWTCMDTNTINATSLDNNSTSFWVIVKGDKMMPRHLALHQTKRYLVWNDAGLGSIMRSNVDGTNRIELARADNASALTIDQNTGRVYWSVSKQIHAVDIDGTNQTVVWKGGWAASMSAYQGALYWGGGERPLMKMLLRRDAPAQPVPHVFKLTAVTTVYKVSRSHPCFNGGSCGAVVGACLADGVCGCGPHCAPVDPCPRHHVRCESSPECIPETWRCDGHADCPDGSDEGPSCGGCAGGVRCTDDSCAASLNACNTGALCGRPFPDAFRCDDDRLCLAPRLLCDGQTHCEDESDEAPSACSVTEKDPVSTAGGQNRVPMWIGIAILIAGVFGLALAVARRYGRATRTRPSRHTTALVLYPTNKHRDTPLGESATEGSESASLCGRYPRPTVNPPPSPATASGPGSAAGETVSAAPLSQRRRAYHRYRAMNRPPPPTPASTDAADSDCAPPSPPPPSPTHTAER